MDEFSGEMSKFVFEHIMHYMMVPGKVENWDVIVDLKDMSLISFPMKVSPRHESA